MSGLPQFKEGDRGPIQGQKLSEFGASLFSQFETRPGHTWPPEKCKLCNPQSLRIRMMGRPQ